MLINFFSLLLLISLFAATVTVSYNCSDGTCLQNRYITRLVLAVLISAAVTFWGLKRKSLDWSGAVSGFLLGIILTFSSFCFLACLLTFFYTSSKATHYCSSLKKKFEADFKEGGQRTWIQVVCNGGMALELALLYLLEGGVGEIPLNVKSDYARSWLASAVLSVLAGVNGDTWASELGTVFSKTQPRLITTFQNVPVGTNGGFTSCGVIFSALGGFVVGAAYFVALLLMDGKSATQQQAFLLSFVGILAGMFGSIVDSFIGATLQYSGLDVRSGKVVERPGFGVEHISGKPVLCNHSVNLIMSVINAVFVPTIALHFVYFLSLF